MPSAIAASEDDFRQWLTEMRPQLHRYCARIAGSVVDGEDIVQEVLINALSVSERFASIQQPEAWLFRIAHNVARREMGRRSARASSSEELGMIEDNRNDPASRVAVHASVRAFLDLVPSQRAAVVLKDVLGFSLLEVCEVTGASLASVKAALHRGRETLRLRSDMPPAAPSLKDPRDKQLLDAYVDRFNAHDFVAVANMLADDVKLSLVGDSSREGAAALRGYFGNYSRQVEVRVRSGSVDLHPAVLFYDDSGSTQPTHFALIDWNEGKIVSIRDFRYARYVLEGAQIAVSMPDSIAQ